MEDDMKKITGMKIFILLLLGFLAPGFADTVEAKKLTLSEATN